MRIRLTLLGKGRALHDVEVRAPSGTTVADVHSRLAAAVYGPAQPLSRGQHGSLWAGSRALPGVAMLGSSGLRSGCVVGVDEPGQRDLVAQAILRLHVICGPDAGTVFALPRGSVTVGRGAECDVRLSDGNCSRLHLELTISAGGVHTRDVASTNGTTLLPDDGSQPQPIDGVGTPLGIGQYVAIGDSVIALATVSTPSAATSPGEDGTQLVNRPPRLRVRPPSDSVDFPELPTSGTAAALPWLAALVPAAGGGALAWFMHNVQFLAFVVLSPILMFATSVGERISGRRSRRQQRREHREQERQRYRELATYAAAETRFRRDNHPDPAEVLHLTTPSARIWERRRTDADFLDVRVGLADRPAWIEVRRGSRPVPPPVLRSVPVWTNLRDGPIGVCGPRAPALGVARWTVTQLVALHSPADLQLVTLLDDADAPAWSWLRWLPHLGASDEQRAAALARTADQRAVVLAHLLGRVESGAPAGQRRWTGPWTVLVVDRASALADSPGLSRLLAQGPDVGITAVCVDDEQHRLPSACASVVQLTGDVGSRVSVRRGATRRAGERDAAADATATTAIEADVLADRVRPAYAERVARALAPLADPGSDAASALPASVRLRTLLDLADLQPATLAARWSANDARVATPLGICADGVFSLDLSRDGPHALIAGTTGAGKSELLQSIVAGLAVQCAPQDLQFVLIDYKGGAAFADCARLPHTAGLVTDLDNHLTERALQSLEAELKRRESLFAGAGVAELPAYRATAEHRVHPLGRLVLVVDEFAALAEELPDFVNGIVGIAQRGRSLGVHLILATQRPAGVISPEIRANVGMRIALRVTDAAESSDVLGSDDAALISKSTPGRSVVAIGGSLQQVQIGRIALPVDTDSARVEVVALDGWGVPITPDRADADAAVTDLHVLVSALDQAAQRTGNPMPRRPWLEPLGTVLDATSLQDLDRWEASITIGMRDLPREQAQRPVLLDLRNGQTMLLAGGARSGRTSTLRTIAALAAKASTVSEIHIYVIDCASGSLRLLDALPHCGAVVSHDSPAAITRLVQRLGVEIDRRARLLAELGVGTVGEARAAGVILPTMLLLLDGWEQFVEAVEDVDSGQSVDGLLGLLRGGAAAGLLAVVAGDRATLAGRLSSATSQRYVLRLTDSTDYTMAGLSRSAVPTVMPPGRAVDTGDATEVQFAVLGVDASTAAQNAVVLAIAEKARLRAEAELDLVQPMRLRALPVRVRLADLQGDQPGFEPHETGDWANRSQGQRSSVRAQMTLDPDPVGTGIGSGTAVGTGIDTGPTVGTGIGFGAALLGVGGDAATPIGVRLFAEPGCTDARFLVAGPPRSGRSNVLQLIAAQLDAQARTGALALVLAGGPRSGLRRWAQEAGLTVLGQDVHAIAAAFEPLTSRQQPTALLIDDCDALLDTSAGEWITDLIRAEHPGLGVVAAGRSEDMAMAFRGVAAEVKRARTGILLQPGPGDGDLLGISLPLRRPAMPVGRGLLLAPGMLVRPDTPSGREPDGAGAEPATDDDAPIPVQIALP